MKLNFNGWLTVAAAGVLSLTMAPQANATVELFLSDGTNSVTIVEGGPGDTCGAANCVSWSGHIGVWNINVSTGTSTFGAAPSLDLNTVNATATAGAPKLTIMTTGIGYTPSAYSSIFSGGGTVNKGGTVTFQAFEADSNNPFDIGVGAGNNGIALSPLISYTAPSLTTSALTMPFNFGPAAGSSPIVPQHVFSPKTQSPYSLTIVSTLVFANGFVGRASSDTTIDTSPVPEPAVVTMLGGLLLLTVNQIRRKARLS